MDGNTQITEILNTSPNNNNKSHNSPINFQDFQSQKLIKVNSSDENSIVLGNHGGSSQRLMHGQQMWSDAALTGRRNEASLQADSNMLQNSAVKLVHNEQQQQHLQPQLQAYKISDKKATTQYGENTIGSKALGGRLDSQPLKSTIKMS